MGAPIRGQDPITPIADELYGVPLKKFTAERKRLADGVRAEGDRRLAARVVALPKPGAPAWAVNRLWREEHEDLETLFDVGRRLRSGEAGAREEQRALLARLARRAAAILRGDGHAASPATLRRVQSTLLSLAAAGGFAPDPPGQLIEDRAPPGFEVLGDEPMTLARREPAAARARKPAGARAAREEPPPRVSPTERRQRAARERHLARLEGRVSTLARRVSALRAGIERSEADLERQRAELARAEDDLADARTQLEDR